MSGLFFDLIELESLFAMYYIALFYPRVSFLMRKIDIQEYQTPSEGGVFFLRIKYIKFYFISVLKMIMRPLQ